MSDFRDHIPSDMRDFLEIASDAVTRSKKVLAISHIDADGISSLAIVVNMLERLNKNNTWRNIHQLNSETIFEVKQLVTDFNPDLVIFSDLGTGQMHLIQEHLATESSVERTIVLDHHLSGDEHASPAELLESDSIIEINPWHHRLSGSYGLSGAGTAFLLAYEVSEDNVDLTELAVVGATGDLQDYYGKGFNSINKEIISLGIEYGYLRIDRDLTFFGINTRPLPYLLQYATDPYLPGITGNEDACFEFFNRLGIELKQGDTWRLWVDLSQDEKQKVIQNLIRIILDAYDDPLIATGIIGDVIILVKRPPRTVLRSAKEFSTLLNACGRNRKPEIGVMICLGDEDAYRTGQTLLQQHRTNLAMALRRLENNSYQEYPGMYVVDDPETPDTIIGIVIGMALGSRIIPIIKPVIGVARNTTDESDTIKISGRCHKSLVDKGVNLRDIFVEVSEMLNRKYGGLIAEAGGHPMAAGAFVKEKQLDEFLNETSSQLDSILN